MSEKQPESSPESQEKSPLDIAQEKRYAERMRIFQEKGAIVANPTQYDMMEVSEALEMSFVNNDYSQKQEKEEKRIQEWYRKSVGVILQNMRQLIMSLNNEAEDKVVGRYDSPEERKKKIIGYKQDEKNAIYETVIGGLHRLRQEKDYKIMEYLEEWDGSKDKKLSEDLEELKKVIDEALKMPEEKE